MRTGDTKSLSAIVKPEDATDKTVSWSSDNPAVILVDQNGIVKSDSSGTAVVTVSTHDGNHYDNCIITVKPPKQPRKTKLVVKAGAIYFYKMHSIAPAIAFGVTDIGGSRFGMEAGGYADVDGYLWGVDASLVFRLVKFISLRAGAGFFSADSYTRNTLGLNAVAGVNILIGKHFCVDVGASYYPEILTIGWESVTTAGHSYRMPTVEHVMNAGVIPSIKIGFTF